MSRGDWLIYNMKDDLIILPRLSIQFKKEQLYMLQMIVGIPDFGDLTATEVNVVLDEKHNYQRYPLLKVGSPNMVYKLVKLLSKALSVDIQRIDFPHL